MANKIALARLLGHSFGDGNIHRSKHYFIYTNSNKKLQERVKKLVKKEFKDVKICERRSGMGVTQLQFSAKVGRKLEELGGIRGSKVHQSFQVPQWIKDGEEKVKVNFLAAIFDDEGYFRDSRGCKQIVLKFSKTKRLEDSLVNFLKEISQLLNELGIKASDIKKDQEKSNSTGEIIVSKRIWITGKTNFIRFKEKIPISHPIKKRKLYRMCK